MTFHCEFTTHDERSLLFLYVGNASECVRVLFFCFSKGYEIGIKINILFDFEKDFVYKFYFL